MTTVTEFINELQALQKPDAQIAINGWDTFNIEYDASNNMVNIYEGDFDEDDYEEEDEEPTAPIFDFNK